MIVDSTFMWIYSSNEKRSEKVKKKERKSVKTTTSVYEDVPQTSIRGQNFVPRTPELTHETAGRTQTSISSYETTTTKGYRGYIVIDGAKSTQQVNYLKINFSIDSKQKTTRIDVDFFTFWLICLQRYSRKLLSILTLLFHRLMYPIEVDRHHSIIIIIDINPIQYQSNIITLVKHRQYPILK